MNLIFKNLFLLFSFLFCSLLFFSFKSHVNYIDEVKNKNQEYIEDHILDSHDLILFSSEKNNCYYGIFLPVIFWDNGIVYFSSKEFHHRDSVVNKKGNFYKLFRGKIYKTDSTGDLKFNKIHYPTVPKIILDLSITKTVLAILIVTILMCIFFITLANSYKNQHILKRSVLNKFLELLIIYIRDEIAKTNIGLKKYKNFMSYLLTLFFFILLLNILGLLPFGFNATGNISVTFCLAIFTYFISQFSGSPDYWKCIFWMPGVPVPIKIFLIPIEFLGTITKSLALMLRLFANMTAGHIIIMTLISMIYYFPNKVISIPSFSLLTLFIYLLEILVTFLQAYVFTILTALLIGHAVKGHHDT